MRKELASKHIELFKKIRLLSNRRRFAIIELVQREPLNITSLSKRLNLAYTKCVDYVRLLEKGGMVAKKRNGKEVLVNANVKLRENAIDFTK